ncbi:MAG: anhydro-N-acetylmuramic acid kinase [Bacteroidetes bacterium]|nr:anhydro-N-acetylmuramic acid kinase [Bacteroidota bacterium]MCL1968796.1 anhydro-N-acetylmuramic acid kinase [Bacteroidota bacterium]
MPISSKQFTPLTILGLMSGTSLDGLDLALCDFNKSNGAFDYKIIKTHTFPYPQELFQKLRDIYDGNALFLCQVEVEFSNFMAQCANQFLENAEKRPHYIASHGHTVFHQPEKGLTKQIGSGAILAAKTGISTICDFRTADVALGGQGAPLVPIGDLLLFHQYEGCLNLGGIANISKYRNNITTACDVTLCNMPLNYLARQYSCAYDKEGALAQKGAVNLDLLEVLNKPDYFSFNAAKSIGYELFATYYRPLLESFSITVEDKLRTVCEHIAIQITHNIEGLQTVLVTGGGAKNRFLIDLIKEKTETKLVIPDEQLVDFKEALIFAFLGYLRMHEEHNALHSVTGADRDSCGGTIYL